MCSRTAFFHVFIERLKFYRPQVVDQQLFLVNVEKLAFDSFVDPVNCLCRPILEIVILGQSTEFLIFLGIWLAFQHDTQYLMVHILFYQQFLEFIVHHGLSFQEYGDSIWLEFQMLWQFFRIITNLKSQFRVLFILYNCFDESVSILRDCWHRVVIFRLMNHQIDCWERLQTIANHFIVWTDLIDDVLEIPRTEPDDVFFLLVRALRFLVADYFGRLQPVLDNL